MTPTAIPAFCPSPGEQEIFMGFCILQLDGSLGAVIIYYAITPLQCKELAKTMRRFLEVSYIGKSMVILSPELSIRWVAGGVNENPWPDQLMPFKTSSPGQIRQTTIPSFRGLGFSAIAVSGIDHADSDLFSSLFYVTTRRVLERLCIIVYETAKLGIIESLLGKKQH